MNETIKNIYRYAFRFGYKSLYQLSDEGYRKFNEYTIYLRYFDQMYVVVLKPRKE
jgi:hypothetical protein